ncbi:MAG: DUF4843 domain-containing protein [Candidatus Pedobacter colombiensis]|uniref:DUF4843 domain-containing protein n=1 Tax=Candidatus Pedobacter colombiensis TaxID=3121371 RepID=A0AAJ5W7N1_9SPHI|nr:DUF4843 domain-containing protein [Pedobacter sp.]WEK18479.1 MAG: DUF4843 domain-containing protein [Pedobacter sp.]
MKAIVKVCSLVFSLGFLLSSCSEKNIAGYENDPRIFFQIPGTGSVALRDSIIYSFPAHPTVKDQDTLWFNACIMGNAAAVDRQVGIKINTDKSTAVEGLNFKIDSKIMPANAFKVRIPIVIYRTGLLNKSVRLQVEVQESKDFKIGYERYNKAVFIWGDKFLKPDIWDTSNYRSAFGTFTETRYAFILKACNTVELPDPMNLVMLGYYNALVRQALIDYNNTPGNTPLTDELGTVGFAIWTGVGGAG